jgi:acyl-coenzyme A synthetase/AMP-(fatty) acid ligase/pimeloyl-ACP methyl ester carboxylesterase
VTETAASASTSGTRAELPGPLPGLDPRWSRLVTAQDAAGVSRTWHALDNGAEATVGTLVCVHGNPTWSYLWRRFLAAAPAGWRVVAVDHLGMGWSDRLEARRTLPERIDDLDRALRALDVTGPVVVAAHDWGGLISLGWALAHRDQLAALVLTNTGVDVPAHAAPPALLRLARSPLLRTNACVRTPTFLRATAALSRPALPADVRAALAAPYGSAARRHSIGDFVADIPFEPDHPSRAALESVAEGVRTLDVPVLMLWGPRDPVFSDRYLRDLLDRMPHADVQRYPRASHLVTEDVPETAEHAWQWLLDHFPADGGARTMTETPTPTGADDERAPWAALTDRGTDPATAVVELGGDAPRSISFAQLEQDVRDLAAGLAELGVRPGDRVSLLVPPGIELTTALYACWRIGAVIVVADAGLGVRAMGRALRGAGPDWVIGIPKALAAVVALRIPGRRIVAGEPPRRALQALRTESSLARLTELGRGRDLPPAPGSDAESAILFTSGATGPAKGVVYRVGQLRAQLDTLRAACGLTREDRMVAAFAPFALYGPALGVGAAVPDMDVTAPGTLTAVALADAVLAVGATVIFASPAALRNVLATQDALSAAHREALSRVRLVMSFGAPVPASLLRAVRSLTPAAELHTPYGMTEALPVADVSLTEIEAAGPGNGVCVGYALPGVTVRISALTPTGEPEGPLTDEPEVTGELCVSAAHVKDRYDRQWATERRSSRNPGWHRTGDVGHLDTAGRIWVEGRLVHILTTAAGVVTPVGIEQRVEDLDEVTMAAIVGVGPAGTQQVVAVVVPNRPGRMPRRPRTRDVLAGPELSAAVRAVAGVPVAAVLIVPALPVDIRHASKIDRARVARWAERVLAGGAVGKL